jgi:hypothetical protein
MTRPSTDLPRPPWTCRLRALCLLTRQGWRPTALAVVDYRQSPVGPYREALVAFATSPWSGRVPWIVVDDAASADAGRAWWDLPKNLADITVGKDRVSVRGPDADFDLAVTRLWPVARVAVPGLLHQPQRGLALVVFTGRLHVGLVTATGTLPAGVRPARRVGLLLSGRLRVGAPRRR